MTDRRFGESTTERASASSFSMTKCRGPASITFAQTRRSLILLGPPKVIQGLCKRKVVLYQVLEKAQMTKSCKKVGSSDV